ncbi:putative acetyltransferase [Pragia fontium]|uniref:N-acetyltransferase n=1 Tax=Pragia fontium TaxID=82985 RepID=A0ABQ5LHU7_9GAMM|nr:GNAT family N-acetyltransferase [Pragia fontium]AKJ42626.1 GCN5 family acetyltransferase [Pragia fontium]GKX62532.1 N-acetyltransferase [Pragia fontium]SUB82965.1 putative acetyltransferase [Pragia fontium]
MTISYKNDALLTPEIVIALYRKCSLGERRPVDKPEVFKKMIDNSNLIITAWDGSKLVGIARSLSDFSYVTYLADLAVDESYQKQGIGKQLMREMQKCTPAGCKIVLLAAPTANDYYPALGFEHNPRAWILDKPL